MHILYEAQKERRNKIMIKKKIFLLLISCFMSQFLWCEVTEISINGIIDEVRKSSTFPSTYINRLPEILDYWIQNRYRNLNVIIPKLFKIKMTKKTFEVLNKFIEEETFCDEIINFIEKPEFINDYSINGETGLNLILKAIYQKFSKKRMKKKVSETILDYITKLNLSKEKFVDAFCKLPRLRQSQKEKIMLMLLKYDNLTIADVIKMLKAKQLLLKKAPMSILLKKVDPVTIARELFVNDFWSEIRDSDQKKQLLANILSDQKMEEFKNFPDDLFEKIIEEMLYYLKGEQYNNPKFWAYLLNHTRTDKQRLSIMLRLFQTFYSDKNVSNWIGGSAIRECSEGFFEGINYLFTKKLYAKNKALIQKYVKEEGADQFVDSYIKLHNTHKKFTPEVISCLIAKIKKEPNYDYLYAIRRVNENFAVNFLKQNKKLIIDNKETLHRLIKRCFVFSVSPQTFGEYYPGLVSQCLSIVNEIAVNDPDNYYMKKSKSDFESLGKKLTFYYNMEHHGIAKEINKLKPYLSKNSKVQNDVLLPEGYKKMVWNSAIENCKSKWSDVLTPLTGKIQAPFANKCGILMLRLLNVPLNTQYIQGQKSNTATSITSINKKLYPKKTMSKFRSFESSDHAFSFFEGKLFAVMTEYKIEQGKSDRHQIQLKLQKSLNEIENKYNGSYEIYRGLVDPYRLGIISASYSNENDPDTELYVFNYVIKHFSRGLVCQIVIFNKKVLKNVKNLIIDEVNNLK